MSSFTEQTIDEEALGVFLKSQNWTDGTIATYIDGLKHTPLRFLFIDNSRMMKDPDGHIFVPLKDSDNKLTGIFKNINVSKWDELVTVVEFQMEVCRHSRVPVLVYFTNGRGWFVLDPADDASFEALRDVLHTGPNSGCDFVSGFDQIIPKLDEVKDNFLSKNLKAGLTIVSDGANDRLKTLVALIKTYPVNVVVRLCTSQKTIIDFWNKTEQLLHLNIDVLDDHMSEALEIHKKNKWLTYGEPLHRFRESAVSTKLDLIDESKLNGAQIREIASIIFGNIEEIPHYDVDKDAFLAYIQSKSELTVFNPIEGEIRPWLIFQSGCNIM